MNNTYLKENKNNIYFMKHLKSYINFSINESDDYSDFDTLRKVC